MMVELKVFNADKENWNVYYDVLSETSENLKLFLSSRAEFYKKEFDSYNSNFNNHFLAELDGKFIGCFKIGNIDIYRGISQFNILRNYLEYGNDLIRLAVKKANEYGIDHIWASYEEQYHKNFLETGFKLIGSRKNLIFNLFKYDKLVHLIPLRKPSKDDVEAIAICLMESHRGGNDVTLGLYNPFTMEAFVEYVDSVFLGNEGKFLWDESLVGFENGKIICAVLLTERGFHSESENVAFLVDIGVIPFYQDRGIGTFVIKSACNALLHKGYKKILLQYTEGNNSAERVYNKLGFKQIGRRVLRSRLLR